MTPPIRPEPRIDWFEKWAEYSPEAVALQDDATGRTYTYGESYRLINRAARMLRDELGVGEGDRVAVLSMNEAEYVFLLFACQKLGAILLPLNYRLAPRELEWILGNAEPAVLIHQRQYDDAVAAIDPGVLPPRRLHFGRAGGPAARRGPGADGDGAPAPADGGGDGGDGPNGESFVARLLDAARPSSPLPVAGDFDTPCMILYTSGTTGRPKGALITNGMLFWNSVNTTLRLDLVQSDVTLTYTPFFHTGGWNVLTTPFLHRGGKLILLDRFDADRILELVDAEGVTILFGLPTIMEMLRRSDRFDGTDFSRVRYAIVGGEPMSLELIRVWHDRGVPIRQGYGLTEFGPNVFSLNEEHAERKIGSIGFPNFYIDARVVDDDDRELGADEVGELVLRGPVCTPGYWRNPEATAEALRGGWFHTGDLVKRDGDGFYYVVDRKKDMYKSGGENVYPVEVEHFLRTHPKVREVAVVGVPDPKWGEVGKAYVVAEEGESLTAAELIDFCAGQLARFKTPKHMELVDELPKGDSGKILKKVLKERARSGGASSTAEERE
jgi:fatty-acyl-CoA synthase